MKIKSLIGALVLSAIAGLAHAEGNYSGMNFGFLIYAAVALGVMALQGTYVLCMAGIGFGTKAGYVLVLLVLDAIVIGMMISGASRALETPIPYIFSVIPGFIAILFFKKHKEDPGS
jgi:hypothetical protein